jgi:hypothetical protein
MAGVEARAKPKLDLMLRPPSLALSRILGARWPRALLDLGWIAAFVGLFWLMVSDSSTSAFSLSGRSVELSLAEGTQRQGLFNRGRRVGTVTWRVEKERKGWRVSHSFQLGAETGSSRAEAVARATLTLRADLSLAGIELHADIAEMGQLSGLVPSTITSSLEELGRMDLRGRCSADTGDCHLVGALGGRQVSQTVPAGRGPVVTSAIYPLLAKGSLGTKAEVRIFDPLMLSQRVVEFQVEGRERLRLRSGQTFDTLRVQRDLEGMKTRVWIDRLGRVLREELPMGLTVEHEAWKE